LKKKQIYNDEEASSYLNASVDTENPFKVIKKELSELEHILEELGIWSFALAYQQSIINIQSCMEYFNDKIETNFIELFLQNLKNIFEQSIQSLLSKEDQDDSKKILEYSSNKLNCLVNLFQANNLKFKQFHSIVFVERRSTAFYLNKLFSKLNELDDYNFIKSDFLYGYSSSKYPGVDIVMNNIKQVTNI
jgi:hypothetical protein